MVTQAEHTTQRCRRSAPPARATGVGLITPLLTLTIGIAALTITLRQIGMLPSGAGAAAMAVIALVNSWILAFWLTH